MSNFQIGLSALRSSQQALEVISNNIANANTEGYHRQKIHLEGLPSRNLSGSQTGGGVDVNYIERIRNRITESSLTDVADVGQVDQLLSLEKQIEAAFLNGSSSIGEELDQFFAEISKLTAAPDEPAQRSSVIEAGQRLASSVQQTAGQLEELRNSVEFQLIQEIELLNVDMQKLSELNNKVDSLTAQGFEPNAELDQRDALINRIANVVGLKRNDHNSGELNMRIGTVAIQHTGSPNEFSIQRADNGEVHLLLDDSERPVRLESGRLAALLEIYNDTIPKYEGKLDTVSSDLIRQVDSIHAVGVGSDGGFEGLLGARSVADPAAALVDAGAAFPIRAGELTISIVGNDGQRRNEVVTIDPTVDSLDDVAATLTVIDGLTASVTANTNQLQLFAAEGVTFDFTGAVETQPKLDLITGTSIPSLSGEPSVAKNQNLSFQIDGSGDVGISDNLFLNVYDDGGSLTQRVNIGNGYEAGSDLDVGHGVKVALSRGTVVAGDQFQTRLTPQPDETGILAALGLNSFFSGVNSTTIGVDESVQENHGRFAAGISGDSADTTNLFRLTELEDFNELPGDLNFSQYINQITVEIGFQVNASESVSSSLQTLQLRLEQDRGAYSGVDLNEEMVYLQQFQKSYEAAARVIQVTDEVLSELFSIFR
jgi:flagellar hook-associated protein FlgK